MWRGYKNAMRRPACRLIARHCLGWFLMSAFLVGTICYATNPDTSPRCSDRKAAVGQEPGTTANSKASAVPPNHSQPHGIKLTWDPSASPKNTVAGYRIFRRESDSSCGSPAGKCGFEPLNPDTLISGTTCTDYDVQPGHTYVYEAQTVGKNTKYSTMSNPATATAR